MQRLVTSLKFVNTKFGIFVYFLLCVGTLTHIITYISDQEDESIWKILAMENYSQIAIGFET